MNNRLILQRALAGAKRSEAWVANGAPMSAQQRKAMWAKRDNPSSDRPHIPVPGVPIPGYPGPQVPAGGVSKLDPEFNPGAPKNAVEMLRRTIDAIRAGGGAPPAAADPLAPMASTNPPASGVERIGWQYRPPGTTQTGGQRVPPPHILPPGYPTPPSAETLRQMEWLRRRRSTIPVANRFAAVFTFLRRHGDLR